MSPLDFTKVDKDKLEFYDAARWEMMAPSMHQEKYNIYGKEIHGSRVLVMSGKRAPWLIRNQLAGWGMSEIERMIADFNLYLQTNNVLYEILDEAKVDIYSIAGFAESLATNDGTALIKTRIQLTNQMKNFHNALLIDKEDAYDQKQLSFSGLAEIKKENRIGLASALRMPMTKLFGLSASGFNSGEDDIENYNAMVESEVREPAKPELRKILKMCLHAYFGSEVSFDFKFKPLRMMTSQEEEQIKASKQQRAEMLYDKALMSSSELGELLVKEDLIPIDTAMTRGELEDHPLAPMPGMAGEGEEGSSDEKKDAGAGPWHRSPKGRMRKKLKSGRYEYKKEGTAPK
jgi:phage-related protein (TIGR01555 family)